MKPTRQLHDPGQHLLTTDPAIFDKAIGDGSAGTAPEPGHDSPARAPDRRCRQPGDTRA